MATTHDEISLREELVSLKRQNTQTAEALRLATGRTRALEEALRKPPTSETRGPRASRGAPALLRPSPPWFPTLIRDPSAPQRRRPRPFADVVAQVANDSRVSELAEELERSRRRERSLQDKLRHLDNSHVSDIQSRVRLFPRAPLPLSLLSLTHPRMTRSTHLSSIVPPGKDCRVRQDAEAAQARRRHQRAEREAAGLVRVAVRQPRARGWRRGRAGRDARRPPTASRAECERHRRGDDAQRGARLFVRVCVGDARVCCRGSGRVAADGE
jgi:hypothetical protein